MALVIVRVPNEKRAHVNEDAFPTETNLYLELIENKEKRRRLDDDEVVPVDPLPSPRSAGGSGGSSDPPHHPASPRADHRHPAAPPREANWLGESVVPPTTSPPAASEASHAGGGMRRTDEQESEDDLKRELLYRFEILRKSYPFTDIPTFTVHNDYSMMKKQYEFLIRKVHLDSNVDSYKSYLIGGFMVIEFIFTRFGLQMDGFCQQQMFQMSKYEKLLIELGEKSYMPKSSWPVELRLCAMILFNALLFGFSKLILQKTGTNLMNMMNERSEGKPTKKMSGPSLGAV